MSTHTSIVDVRERVIKSLQKYPQFLTYEEVAEILNISKAAVYKLAHRRAFPRVAFGRRTVRVPKEALIQFILDRWQESFEEAWQRYRSMPAGEGLETLERELGAVEIVFKEGE